jgi:putative addiction module killer protein
MKITVLEYLTHDGGNPFRSWLEKLDRSVRERIQARIFRFELGNFGDHKSVGGGVWEARMDFGPGYRVYFGKDGLMIVLLLLGGDKSSQANDIERAQEFWKRYIEVKKHGKKK